MKSKLPSWKSSRGPLGIPETQVENHWFKEYRLQRQCWASLRGRSRWGIGGDLPRETYKSSYLHYDFVQFVKQHSQCKAILPSMPLSQQCC